MIKNFQQKLRGILNGSSQIDDETKYSLLIILMALIHVGFSLFYLYFKIMPFVVYNLVSCILYLVLGRIFTKRRNYFQIFNTSVIEIVFFAASSTLLLGWDFGYMLYFLCLIPIAFYLLFTNPKYYGNLKLPFLYAISFSLIYAAVKIVSFQVAPYYAGRIPAQVMSAMYLFNVLLACLFQTGFSFLFVYEVRCMQDVLRHQNMELDMLASVDPLTKLCNRRSMEQHLNRSMSIAKSNGIIFSVIIGDIDDFKKVNDTYGHEFGDKVLENVASILTSQMRENDHVCRWGGEEFLLLINADKEIAKGVGERIRTEIEKSIVMCGEISLSITMTFGVKDYVQGCSVEKIISLADENLYRGKQNGKNQVVA